MFSNSPFQDIGLQIGCGICDKTVGGLQALIENKKLDDTLEFVAYEICRHFKIEGGIPSVCEGGVTIMAGALLQSLGEGVIAPRRICDEVLHMCKTPTIERLDGSDFVSRVMAGKPEIIKNNTFVDDLYKKIAADPNQREIVRGIHFSDPHVDFYYEEGQEADCKYPVCCRNNGVIDTFSSIKRPAPKWGDYNCDIPTTTLKSMFDFIGNNQDSLKTDFITWTGDNSAHNVWDNTAEEITSYTKNITAMLKESLGEDSEMPIFPIQGNHDTWPVNV